MSKFIKVKIDTKPIGAQVYPTREVFLSSDIILLVKKVFAEDEYSLFIKPEYETAVKEAIGLDKKDEFSSIISESKEVNTLFSVVKA